jgi:tetratricopeptide (TPR) repeat protein
MVVEGVLLVGGAVGFVRWWWESHPAPALVVARFNAAAELASRAEEVQRIVVATLDDFARSGRFGRVVAVKEIVGQDRGPFAALLRRRLRAALLLYGDVRSRSDGGHTIYARLLRPAPERLIHRDYFTFDDTPIRTTWREMFHALTPARDVEDVEYPFDFATEVDSVLRALESELLMKQGEYVLAERRLREALDAVRTSESPAVDEIRILLAWALDGQGRRQEAIATFRRRAAQATASPHFLRVLAGSLSPSVALPSPQEIRESLELLKRAAESRNDPLREHTLYNLSVLLAQDPATREEAFLINRELLRSRTHYRRAWYVLRIEGLRHWEEAERRARAGDGEGGRLEAAEAAYWYGRACRARPKLAFERYGRRWWQVRAHRLPPSPKMYANLTDAHLRAGHRRRGAHYNWREERLRRKSAARGQAALTAGNPLQAIAHFERAVIGAGDDLDAACLASEAVAARLAGRPSLANEAGRRARETNARIASEVYNRLMGGL